MNRKRITLIAAVTVFMVVFRPSIFGFDDGSDRPRPLVFSPDSVILGMTYGDWSAAFWQTVFAIPASINPIQETTSANCIIGPSSGPVLFLNPSGVPGALVTRTCSVPAGKPLWLAIVVNECSTIEPPPSRGDNPLELRACAGIIADGIGTDTIKLTIDGVKVRGLRQFRTVSPLFTIVIQETDNLFGVTGVTSGSSVSDGFSVMLAPLSLGRHQIHAEGAFVTGPSGGALFSVTYNLTAE